MRKTAAPLGALVWLLFTANPEARADDARWRRSGGIVRLGTAVGFSEIGERSISTLGGQLSIGYRLGPLAVGAELEKLAMLQYLEEQTRNATRGDLMRAGVSGRLFVLRLGGGQRTSNSLMELYVEAGAGRQRGRWVTGETFDRTDVSAGAGWLQDARYRRGRGRLPFHSIGWQLGWRLTAARADGEDVFLRQTCKGKACRPPPMPGPDIDLGFIFTCSMTAAW